MKTLKYKVFSTKYIIAAIIPPPYQSNRMKCIFRRWHWVPLVLTLRWFIGRKYVSFRTVVFHAVTSERYSVILLLYAWLRWSKRSINLFSVWWEQANRFLASSPLTWRGAFEFGCSERERKGEGVDKFPCAPTSESVFVVICVIESERPRLSVVDGARITACFTDMHTLRQKLPGAFWKVCFQSILDYVNWPNGWYVLLRNWLRTVGEINWKLDKLPLIKVGKRTSCNQETTLCSLPLYYHSSFGAR